MRNKVTIEHLEEQIIKEQYLKLGTKMTACILTLKNGFEIVGISGCVDPNNYDLEIGSKFAREKAIDQLWNVEGYLLQQEVFNEIP